MKNDPKVLDKCLKYFVRLLLAVMILVVLYQVFTRTVLNNPNTVTEEFVRFGLVWLSMLASAYVVGKKSHLAVTMLSDNLTGSKKRLLEVVVQVLFLIFAAVIMIFGGWKAVTVTMGQVSPSLSLSMGYVYLAVPVAGVFMFIYSLLNLFDEHQEVEAEKEEVE